MARFLVGRGWRRGTRRIRVALMCLRDRLGGRRRFMRIFRWGVGDFVVYIGYEGFDGRIIVAI